MQKHLQWCQNVEDMDIILVDQKPIHINFQFNFLEKSTKPGIQYTIIVNWSGTTSKKCDRSTLKLFTEFCPIIIILPSEPTIIKTSQELRMLSSSFFIQRSQINSYYCCSQLSAM